MLRPVQQARRLPMRRSDGWRLLVSFAIVTVACSQDLGGPGGGGGGGAGGGPDSGASTPAVDAANPTGVAVRLAIEPFTVPAGTERQVCKRVNLPVDQPTDFVRLRSTMVGTSHHFNVYKAIGDGATDPVPAGETIVHDCPPASDQLGGSAAYIFGASSTEKIFDTPESVAFHFEPGQVLILEHHVINATSAVIEGEASFELVAAAPDADIQHHADVMWLGNWYFYIPPGQESSATEMCKVDYDVEIFGLWSHFHEMGVHFSIEHWTPSGTTHIYESSDWAHPVFKQFAPAYTLRAGEGIEWTCTWFNTRPNAIIPGQNSTDEMCIAFGVGYPKNSLSAPPISCNPPWF
jgi:hypothetical protein